MHPKNKYAERPPDFNVLASLYPSFKQYVKYTQNGRPKIDWTDFNATKELTTVLLEHDYAIKWFIPDGHLCPTVPNRANYIHWINDLLSITPPPWHENEAGHIIGLDIGTGANCIYPLLGASLYGWHFVGTDITPTALKWAKKNVEQNSSLSNLIEIRNSGVNQNSVTLEKGCSEELHATPHYACSDFEHGEVNMKLASGKREKSENDVLIPGFSGHPDLKRMKCEDDSKGHVSPAQTCGKDYDGPPVLVDAIKDGERFDFCMCNPPFFNSIEEASANPHTACGGTLEEMVCPGGELSFITRMIEDSIQLKGQIHWYTTMVGRKVNLKVLIPKLRKIGVTMLRTTEFVQGRTSRWGLAWSFTLPQKGHVPNLLLIRHASGRSQISFMLEGLPRSCRVDHVLKALTDHLQELGAVCEVDNSSFLISGRILTNKGFHDPSQNHQREDPSRQPAIDDGKMLSDLGTNTLQFNASIFQQAPGTLLVKASLLRESNLTGAFSAIFNSAEQVLKKRFSSKVQQKK